LSIHLDQGPGGQLAGPGWPAVRKAAYLGIGLLRAICESPQVVGFRIGKETHAERAAAGCYRFMPSCGRFVVAVVGSSRRGRARGVMSPRQARRAMISLVTSRAVPEFVQAGGTRAMLRVGQWRPTRA